ncbi:MAG: hypothetical protein A2847_02355 [Candidatus Sungbacteria bacterium RIFCSPHIGHO2_01_FULL_50_25]|uniref:DUF5666 domain-containing protein n=1 Tax=Candidatus Sungbacteria bacterium RIFCSPHIGHO2_01_FULL_50_25 TaxID=1802265 RepID=A0A1G2K9S6_9BACT|nr:MAG: hypothetical protein A2847_02355 [Candidatus Sungbacteria bacterium RIFCSPHIGHO2_01_FULL_50_25]
MKVMKVMRLMVVVALGLLTSACATSDYVRSLGFVPLPDGTSWGATRVHSDTIVGAKITQVSTFHCPSAPKPGDCKVQNHASAAGDGAGTLVIKAGAAIAGSVGSAAVLGVSFPKNKGDELSISNTAGASGGTGVGVGGQGGQGGQGGRATSGSSAYAPSTAISGSSSQAGASASSYSSQSQSQYQQQDGQGHHTR